MATTRKLTAGETYAQHPDGGFVIAHPDRQPVWYRVENGVAVETVIEPITPAPAFVPGQGQVL